MGQTGRSRPPVQPRTSSPVPETACTPSAVPVLRCPQRAHGDEARDRNDHSRQVGRWSGPADLPFEQPPEPGSPCCGQPPGLSTLSDLCRHLGIRKGDSCGYCRGGSDQRGSGRRHEPRCQHRVAGHFHCHQQGRQRHADHHVGPRSRIRLIQRLCWPTWIR